MTEPSEPSTTVCIERTFDAPPGEVFDAWTSAEVMKRWWHAEHSWETPFAAVVLRIGGSIRVTMRNPADGTEYGGGGEYTAIDRPRHLAFTWTWDGDDESRRQLIEIEFVDRGERTTVILTNRGVPYPDVEDHRTGWQNAFDNLAEALRPS
ncbi:MAG: SRPBCC family protein [Acidimicrobiia bacterium]